MTLTASTLTALMMTELGPTFAALGEETMYPSLVEAVSELEAMLGTTIALTSDQLKLRVLARWAAWRVAKGQATGQYNLQSGTTSLTRSQYFDHIDNMLRDAETAALRYSEVVDAIGSGSVAYVGSVESSPNPYRWLSSSGWGY